MKIFHTAAITIQSTLTTHSPMMTLGIGGPIDYQDDRWHAYQENLLLSITTFHVILLDAYACLALYLCLVTLYLRGTLTYMCYWRNCFITHSEILSFPM